MSSRTVKTRCISITSYCFYFVIKALEPLCKTVSRSLKTATFVVSLLTFSSRVALSFLSCLYSSFDRQIVGALNFQNWKQGRVLILPRSPWTVIRPSYFFWRFSFESRRVAKPPQSLWTRVGIWRKYGRRIVIGLCCFYFWTPAWQLVQQRHDFLITLIWWSFQNVIFVRIGNSFFLVDCFRY